MSQISTQLKRDIMKAAEREYKDDHLSFDERHAIVERIRQEDNIDPEVTSEQIYEEYVIDSI